MVMQVFAWIMLITIAAIMLSRRPVRNCQGCVWAKDGHCGHPTASRVPELLEIQLGMWRCPWRELANDKRDLMITWGGNESRQSADPTVRELTADDNLTIEYVPIGQLKPFDGNPRKISDKGLEKLQRSVEEFGFINPVLVQRGTNMIIAGHQRIKAAKAAGLTEVPTVTIGGGWRLSDD